jgi:hypothetical protein
MQGETGVLGWNFVLADLQSEGRVFLAHLILIRRAQLKPIFTERKSYAHQV